VAVWVGFIALFGIATDDGVLMGTYLTQSFKENKHSNLKELRQEVVIGGHRRIKACTMTTTTTIIALLPIFTSTGKGADIETVAKGRH
jgi:copper/silver efflux system protein